MQIKDSGSINVTNNVTLKKDDVILMAADVDLANFKVAASNNTEGVDLTSMTFALFVSKASSLSAGTDGKLNKKHFTVEVDGDDISVDDVALISDNAKKKVACEAGGFTWDA
jgi:predicted RecA/RadA family phage recombinase